MELSLEQIKQWVLQTFFSRAQHQEASKGRSSAGMPVILNRDGKLASSLQVSTGTWSPTITCATPGTLSITYTSQDGEYTLRAGQKIDFSLRIIIDTFTLGTATGNIFVSLPIEVKADSFARCTIETQGVDLPGTPAGVVFAPSGGNTHGLIRTINDDASASNVTISALASGDTIVVSGSYLRA